MDTHDAISRHLDLDYTHPVRDPIWKNIHLSDPMLKLIDTAPYRQLSRIKQLGPAYLVYPGATHTRLGHSLGVFHLAKRIIKTLVSISPDSILSVDGVKAFLTAALLHDLGHFPYTHSFKELPLTEHESLTGELVLQAPIREILRDDMRVDPHLVSAVVDESADYTGDPQLAFFRNVLSGALDPDKLDYLNRDAYFCGVPYGEQDIDFALSRIFPVWDEGIGLDATGISAVENILFSKYLMYRAVYWHRTVRVATAMIKKAVYLALREEVIAPSELYGLDDELFFLTFDRAQFDAFDLIERVYDRQLYRPVFETPFDGSNPRHRDLESLDTRAALEERIAERLAARSRGRFGPESVIVDVPERISFEVSIPVRDGEQVIPYPQSDTVFTPQVVADFTATLRKIRLIVHPDLTSHVHDAAELLEL
ncbi:MAG: HD domain-containing protein [Spirochaetes bacterium]|nr:HD domain-containing protein [Spirochaetota bacterium]